MSSYELTVVLPGKAKAKEKTIKEKIAKIVENLKGKVADSTSWGEIELAYRINKEKSGYYLHFQLELASDSIQKLDDKLRTEEELLRYLLVRK